MDVTEDGIVTDVNPLHSSNALFLIDVTEDGIVTDVNPLHFQKANLPMDVTEDGMSNRPTKVLFTSYFAKGISPTS
jgi:hypothetical protein